MSNSDQHLPPDEASADGPELDLLQYEDEGLVKLFEPEAMGAYIVVDEYSVMQLCECA